MLVLIKSSQTKYVVDYNHWQDRDVYNKYCQRNISVPQILILYLKQVKCQALIYSTLIVFMGLGSVRRANKKSKGANKLNTV